MCACSTCLPTPDEARELIRQGYGPRLAHYRFGSGAQMIGPAPKGHEGTSQLQHTKMGACTFFDGALCTLHDKGLKPLEGRLAHHDVPWLPVRMHVMSTWKGKQFESVQKAWVKSCV